MNPVPRPKAIQNALALTAQGVTWLFGPTPTRKGWLSPSESLRILAVGLISTSTFLTAAAAQADKASRTMALIAAAAVTISQGITRILAGDVTTPPTA